MPNVLQIQKAISRKAVFIWLYQRCGDDGLIELDADAISQDIEISRRQIYRAISFLRRVNLIVLKLRRTGRGNHSLFYVNWKKSERKCASTPISKTSKNHIHDRPRRSNTTWDKKLKAFRELMQHSWLMPTEQALCTGVLGRHLKSRTTEYARQLYDALARIIGRIDAPSWVMTVQDLCRWWMSVLKGLGGKLGLES